MLELPDNGCTRIQKTHLSGIHGKGGFAVEGDVVPPGRWNKRWREFQKEFEVNPEGEVKEVYQFAGQLVDEFGLSALSIVPHPRRR